MKIHSKRIVVSLAVLGTMGALLLAQGQQPGAAKAMVQAAEKFRATLPPDQLAKCSFAFEDPQRLDWHFIPKPRKGLALRELKGDSIKAAQDLIASGLSKSGYEQALSIMSMEEVLYLLEGGDREKNRENRNPGKYYISFFGTPSETGKWGLSVEGHHLSLNYTIDKGEVISSTPEFFGANPAYLGAGPKREIRPLGTEEDLARQILKLSNPDQMKVMLVDAKSPGEVRGANKAQAEVTTPFGLQVSKFSADQKDVLGKLLSEYLKNMPADVSAARRTALERAGSDNIYFGWWGGKERNEPHQYYVQGPTFIIEYNNTQNEANHVHSFWRDLGGDFGIAVKK